MKRLIALTLALVLSLTCVPMLAQTQSIQPFSLNGTTGTFTAAGTCPTAVQILTPGVNQAQYVITNTSTTIPAFIAFASTAAQAATNCVIPTATQQPVYVILPYTQIVVTTGGNAFFTGITASSTAIIYVSSGQGS